MPAETPLGDISHTNPFTDRAFGETQTYDRGKTVVADGGESESTTESKEGKTLEDIDHSAPDNEDGSQRTFDRGETR